MYKSQIEQSALLFSNVETYDSPFRFFQVQEVLSPNFAEELLKWFETTNNFIMNNKSYFKNATFHVSSNNVPMSLQHLVTKENMFCIKKKVEEIFDVKFQDRFIISVHRYLPGEGTLIHNDILEEGSRDEHFFTHRFLVYLNRSWEKSDGGVLGIFNSNNPESLEKLIEPLHNTAVGLAFTRKSWHAVSAVSKGTRYALHFNFVSEDNKYEDEK